MADDPLALFQTWFDAAIAAGIAAPEAMVLATADAQGSPSARVVLFRGLSGGGFRFFTNYQSRKGAELEDNPRAALVFHWEPQARQIRIEGGVERLPAEESDAYFAARPHGHRLGAWASPQSRPIAAREEILERHRELAAKYGDGPVPRPPHWGGYRVIPERIEFWEGREDRLHERALFVREGDRWLRSRLAP
jgi:pyridoxamine 5'-phosphate oxidase